MCCLLTGCLFYTSHLVLKLSITWPCTHGTPICCYLPLLWVRLLSFTISFRSIWSDESPPFALFFSFQFWRVGSDRPCSAPVLMSLPRHASTSYISFLPLSTANLNNAGIFSSERSKWDKKQMGKPRSISNLSFRSCPSHTQTWPLITMSKRLVPKSICKAIWLLIYL